MLNKEDRGKKRKKSGGKQMEKCTNKKDIKLEVERNRRRRNKTTTKKKMRRFRICKEGEKDGK